MSSIKQFSLFEQDIRQLEFRKPSALTQISNKGNLNQRKVMNPFLIIAKDVLKRYPNADLFQVDLGVLKAMAGIKKQNNKKFKKDLKELTTMGFEYNILKKEEQDWGAFPFLSFININSKRGQTAKVIFSLPPPIRVALKNPKMRVKLRLFMQHNMTSKFGIPLRETLSDYVKLDKITYKLEQFKRLMGVEPHQYKVITMFKKKVLEVGLKEVNEQTNISATYEFEKEGKKIVGITFFPKLKKEVPTEKNINETIANKLKYYGFKDIEIKNLLKERDEDYLLANIAVVENYLEQGRTIENVKAYMKSAFKDDYRPQETEHTKKQQLALAEKQETQAAEQVEAEREKKIKDDFTRWKKGLTLDRFQQLEAEKQEELKAEFIEQLNDFMKVQLKKMGFENNIIQGVRQTFLVNHFLSNQEKELAYFQENHRVEEVA